MIGAATGAGGAAIAPSVNLPLPISEICAWTIPLGPYVSVNSVPARSGYFVLMAAVS